MPHFIVIAGASASGKTTLAKWLKEKYGTRAALIRLDDYYLPRNDPNNPPSKTYDEPAAFDMPRLKADFRKLNQGEAIDKPLFDFAGKNRKAETERIDPSELDFIIFEGILTLNDIDSYGLDPLTKVFVETDSYPTIVHNRTVRDAISQWKDGPEITKHRELKCGVRDAFFTHILPTKQTADIVVTNTFKSDITLDEVRALLNPETPAENLACIRSKMNQGVSFDSHPDVIELVARLEGGMPGRAGKPFTVAR